jgi:hypothetical protein
VKRNPGYEVPKNTPAFFDRIEMDKAKGKAAAEKNRAHLERTVKTHDRFQASWALKNMIRALNMMTWKNTVDDWQRLFEAEIIMKARRKSAKKRKPNPGGRTIEYDGLLWNKTDFLKKIHLLEVYLKSDVPDRDDKYHGARLLQSMKDKLSPQRNNPHSARLRAQRRGEVILMRGRIPLCKGTRSEINNYLVQHHMTQGQAGLWEITI